MNTYAYGSRIDTAVRALEEIRNIAEDRIDYDTADWHLVLKLARQALGEGE